MGTHKCENSVVQAQSADRMTESMSRIFQEASWRLLLHTRENLETGPKIDALVFSIVHEMHRLIDELKQDMEKKYV